MPDRDFESQHPYRSPQSAGSDRGEKLDRDAVTRGVARSWKYYCPHCRTPCASFWSICRSLKLSDGHCPGCGARWRLRSRVGWCLFQVLLGIATVVWWLATRLSVFPKAVYVTVPAGIAFWLFVLFSYTLVLETDGDFDSEPTPRDE